MQNNRVQEGVGVQKPKRRFVVDDFDEKAIFLCQFCGGSECKQEDFRTNRLHSNWITKNILAMQRPSQRLIKQFKLYSIFKENKINTVLNLQEPGEHPYCGDGIIPNVGFSYIPEHFYQHGINCFSQSWEDMGCTSFEHMMRIMNIFDMSLSDGGCISVHCHAGRGRTLLVICSWLIYNDRIPALEAIKLAKQKRQGVLGGSGQRAFLVYFEEQLRQRWKSFGINPQHHSFSNFVQWQTLSLLKKQKNRLNSTAVAHFRIVNELRRIATKDPMSVTQAFINPKSFFFKIKWNQSHQKTLLKLKNQINQIRFQGLEEQDDPRILTELLFDFYQELPFTLMTTISIECIKDQISKIEQNSKLKVLLSPSIVHNIGVEGVATILDFILLIKQIIKSQKNQKQKSFKDLSETKRALQTENQTINDNLEWSLYMRLTLLLLCKRKFLPQLFRGDSLRQCTIYRLGPKILKVIGSQVPFLHSFLIDLSKQISFEQLDLEPIVFKAKKVESNLFYFLKEGNYGSSLSGEAKTNIYQSSKVHK